MPQRPLTFSLATHVTRAFDGQPYDLNWAANLGISQDLLGENSSPLHLHDLTSARVLRPDDQLEFDLRGQTWRVKLVESSKKKFVSVESVAPSPQAGITVSDRTGFKDITKGLLRAYDPVLYGSDDGQNLKYSDVQVYRGANHLGNAGDIRLAYDIYRRNMKKYKERVAGQ
ncbi:MAG: hypothetical protein Q9196_006284 [Gyalolechia fulgens]